VTVRLNATGRKLAARAGGVKVRLLAAVTQAHISSKRYATASSTVVAPNVTLRPIYFDFDSSSVAPADVAYLASLRGMLAHTKAIHCAGYTDFGGSSLHEQKLGEYRARHVCELLNGAAHGPSNTISYGGTRPVQTAGAPVDRSRNRRVVITLKY